MIDTFETILDGIDEADLLPVSFTLEDLEGIILFSEYHDNLANI